MTEQEREERRKETVRKEAILVHSIAEQITSVPNITFAGALYVVERVKNIIENDMKSSKAYTSPEIRDKWGTIIDMPQASTQGLEN